MVGKTAAERKAKQRARDSKTGFERFEVKAHPDDHAAIKRYVERLNKRRERK